MAILAWRPGQAGWTLIELMVVVSLVMVLAVPMVLQVPGERVIFASSATHSSSLNEPAWRSSQNMRVCVPAPTVIQPEDGAPSPRDVPSFR